MELKPALDENGMAIPGQVTVVYESAREHNLVDPAGVVESVRRIRRGVYPVAFTFGTDDLAARQEALEIAGGCESRHSEVYFGLANQIGAHLTAAAQESAAAR